MNHKALSESLAEALQSIADMPVVDDWLTLSFGDVVSAYHEALKIARDAVSFYDRTKLDVCDMDCETCQRKICTGAKKMQEDKENTK